jgi:hypothetical protein
MTTDQAQASADVAYEPLKVHVVASDVAAPARKQKKYRTTFLTVHLVTGDLTKLILPASDERIIAHVKATVDGKDATLSGRESDAAAGSGFILSAATLAPWPIQESGPVYASGADGTIVTLTAVYCTLE